jgi:hypothetical protein
LCQIGSDKISSGGCGRVILNRCPHINNIFPKWIKLFNFLWNNKVDKVKRNTVIGNYEDGGLKMPHVLSFDHTYYSITFNFIYFIIPEKIKEISWIFLTIYICTGGSGRTVKG